MLCNGTWTLAGNLWGRVRGWPPSQGELAWVRSRSSAVAQPEPHGDFPVVPLIGDQRYYGEVPVKSRRGPRGGRVQDGRGKGPGAGLLGRQAGSRGQNERRKTRDDPEAVRRTRRSQGAASLPRCVRGRKTSHRIPRRARNWSASASTPACYATRRRAFRASGAGPLPALAAAGHQNSQARTTAYHVNIFERYFTTLAVSRAQAHPFDDVEYKCYRIMISKPVAGMI
jgi:hypothetical protein